MKKSILIGAGILALALSTGLADLNVSSDFSTNPLTTGGWTFGAGSNVNNQFTWDQPNSSLDVHLDSSLPTARLDLPIGATLTTSTDFTVTAKFSFTITSAPDNEDMEMAFGLVNHTLTGGDRTGTLANSGSDNVFSTVEFNYFPSVSPEFNDGRTLTPSVFGAQAGAGADAFSNFASVFGPGSDLGKNVSPAITALPQSTLLQVTMNYVASTELLSLTVQQINGDGSLTTLETDVPALDLSGFGPTFDVDSLAIMAYGDGYNAAEPQTALVGDMAFQQISVVSPAPEPATTALTLLGASGMLSLFRRRRA